VQLDRALFDTQRCARLQAGSWRTDDPKRRVFCSITARNVMYVLYILPSLIGSTVWYTLVPHHTTSSSHHMRGGVAVEPTLMLDLRSTARMCLHEPASEAVFHYRQFYVRCGRRYLRKSSSTNRHRDSSTQQRVALACLCLPPGPKTRSCPQLSPLLPPTRSNVPHLLVTEGTNLCM
jgi:hypothetical protein